MEDKGVDVLDDLQDVGEDAPLLPPPHGRLDLDVEQDAHYSSGCGGEGVGRGGKYIS